LSTSDFSTVDFVAKPQFSRWQANAYSAQSQLLQLINWPQVALTAAAVAGRAAV
jgi:hypothetical protein